MRKYLGFTYRELKRKSSFKKKLHQVANWSILAVLAGVVLGVWLLGHTGETPKAISPTAGVPVVYTGTNIPITEPVPWRHSVPQKIGASHEQNTLIAWAYDKWRDEKFIYLLEAEAGWRFDAVGVNKDGSKDSGVCQINHYWHPEIVNNPNFQDKYWQLEQCYRLYSGGTKFYGMSKIGKAKNNFIWKV